MGIFLFFFLQIQANGLDERFNQTLQNMLSKFVQENKESWDSFLDTCTFGYNTSRHESTLHTPFELMFGRQAVLPIDLDMEKQSPEQLLQEYEDASADQPGKKIAAIATLRQALLQQVKNNIVKVQKK